jgi:hypothetical protein
VLDHWIERTVHVVWGTAQHDAGHPLATEPLAQGLYQAGFANASLAAEQDHLPQPVLTLRPAFHKQRQFGIAPNQRR